MTLNLQEYMYGTYGFFCVFVSIMVEHGPFKLANKSDYELVLLKKIPFEIGLPSLGVMEADRHTPTDSGTIDEQKAAPWFSKEFGRFPKYVFLYSVD